METRDYVRKHWAFHADQSLRTFHFFILVVTVILAGLFTYLKDARYPAFAAPVCLLIPILCWIFWRMDCRNRVLIRHAEDILKAIEEIIPADVVPVGQQLFIQEKRKTDEMVKANYEKSWWNPARQWHIPLSFYDSFRAIFIVFGIFGVGICITALSSKS
jgi:hypothetical protein